MILFEEIYNKAVVLFDDPKITQAYEQNRIVFCKYMYGYLQNVSIYEPIAIGQMLADITPPKGEMEVFEGDGVHKEFNVTMTIPENSIIIFREDGEIVTATYNKDTKKVTFPHVLGNNKQYIMEYYFPGAYNFDFNTKFNEITAKDVVIKIKNILSRLVVTAWAESVRNMLVDIQGLLRDTDFKATPNSQILNAKIAWIAQLGKQNNSDIVKLSWYLRYSSKNAKYTR